MPNEKAILSKPPLSILLNPDEIKSSKPWEFDLQELLAIFITVLDKMEIPDLRLCGSAALSSALIYRLKVESLFLFEKLRAKRHVIDRTDPLQTIDMPYRFELPTTSLDDLVSTLEIILNELLAKETKKPAPKIIEVEPILEVDIFTVQIQKALKELKRDIANVLRHKKKILFSEYVEGLDILEKLRRFLLLLFVANEGLIRMIQHEDDIIIMSVKRDVAG